MIFDYFYVLYAYIYSYLCIIKPVYQAKADYRTYPPEYRPGGTRPVFRRVNPIYFHPVPRSEHKHKHKYKHKHEYNHKHKHKYDHEGYIEPKPIIFKVRLVL
jgi:hypothetical protein